MRTLIINHDTNKVENAIEAPEGFEIPGKLLIASETGGPGDDYDPETGEIIPNEPVVIRFETAGEAIDGLYDLLDNFTLSVTGRVLIDEKQAWPAKEDAARAYFAGTALNYQYVLLASEAELTGETVDDLAAKIIANADQYRALIAVVTAIRRNAEIAINAVSDGFDAIIESVEQQLSEIPR